MMINTVVKENAEKPTSVLDEAIVMAITDIKEVFEKSTANKSTKMILLHTVLKELSSIYEHRIAFDAYNYFAAEFKEFYMDTLGSALGDKGEVYEDNKRNVSFDNLLKNVS